MKTLRLALQEMLDANNKAYVSGEVDREAWVRENIRLQAIADANKLGIKLSYGLK